MLRHEIIKRISFSISCRGEIDRLVLLFVWVRIQRQLCLNDGWGHFWRHIAVLVRSGCWWESLGGERRQTRQTRIDASHICGRLTPGEFGVIKALCLVVWWGLKGQVGQLLPWCGRGNPNFSFHFYLISLSILFFCLVVLLFYCKNFIWIL